LLKSLDAKLQGPNSITVLIILKSVTFKRPVLSFGSSLFLFPIYCSEHWMKMNIENGIDDQMYLCGVERADELDGKIGGKCEQGNDFSICQNWALDKAQFLMDGKIIGKKWSVPKWEGKKNRFC
jgi:hypothetical protein